MRSLFLSFCPLFLALAACTPREEAAPALPTVDGSTPVRFLSAKEGGEFLGQEDAYLARLNNFNRQLRLGTDQTITPGEYAAFAADQTLDWTPKEKVRLTRLLAKYAPKLEAYDLDWPEQVQFIKTTGKEDFDAAYTRGNAIILPQRVLTGDEAMLTHFILHELFHIYSRHASEDRRNQLYAVVGHQPTAWLPPLPYPFYAIAQPKDWPRLFKPRDISLPHPLVDETIVNPDAFTYRHVIPVSIGMTQLYGLPVLFSRESDPVAGAEMGLQNIMGFRLLLVRPNSLGRWRMDPTQRRNGFVSPHEVDGFWQSVGRNTDYIIHPEEILADNFVLLIAGAKDVKSPKILEKLDAALRADTE